MFRAGLTLLRRVTSAASLLILLICGAEVGVRIYEASTGSSVGQKTDGVLNDPSNLAIPSWSFYQELRPVAVATVACRDSKAEIEFRTNSLGLRGIEPVIPKPSHVCRIVVLGDDTIYAPETSDSEHFCSLLQNLLQQRTQATIEVINAGIPGHCPLTEYLLFKQRLLALQPDLVLLHFDWSDVADDQQIRRRARCDSAGIPQSCPHIKLATVKKMKIHEVWRQQFRLLDWGLGALSVEWKQQLALQKAASRDVDTNPYAWLRDERPEKNAAFFQTVRPILDLARLCQSSYSQLVIMTSPKPWQVSANCSSGAGVRLAAGVARDACFPGRAPFDVLARFAENSKIPLVDGSMIFPPGRETEANFLRHAPRWSPVGHRRLAEQVASFLAEKIPGAWNSPYFQQNEQPVKRSAPREPAIQWTSGQQLSPPRGMPITGRSAN
jgi:hypothetical protein